MTAGEPRDLRPRAIVDETHCGRHVTGIERITLELFSADALAPFAVDAVRSANRSRMMLDQLLTLPLRSLRKPDALVLCSGFPPTPPLSLRGRRVVAYIHDLFLLTRPQELNWRARAYMAPSLRFALKRLTRFLANSETTRDELLAFTRPDADVRLHRPLVRNVLGLDAGAREKRGDAAGPRLLAIGTVEPRKNLLAAARIVEALRAQGFPDARLDVIGREGWGQETERLKRAVGVTLHGYLPIERIRAIVDESDVFISTSHAEGLGLPLLEAQYAGLPIAAPDQRVFREVLGNSGVFIDPADSSASAARIASLVSNAGWRRAWSSRSLGNVQRWNALARGDHAATIAWLLELAAELRRRPPSP